MILEHPLLDQLLTEWQSALATDAIAYRNHCYRVFNFYAAFIGTQEGDAIDKGAIALAFHDLGIWTHHTLDYLEPSAALAHLWLSQQNRSDWSADIGSMIVHHHHVTAVAEQPLAEALRKADWVDFSLGLRRFGLTGDFIRQVQEHFPNAGFHRMLLQLGIARAIRHPLSPLPMFKW